MRIALAGAGAFMLGQEHAQTAADNLKALASQNKLSELLAESNDLPTSVGHPRGR